jgi:sec-independent protein translocase protein TatA
MGDLSPWHLLILAAVVVILFGSRKLPGAARSLGQSMRILKTEVQGLHEDENKPPAVQQPGAQPVPGNDGTTYNGVALSEAQQTQQPR